MAEQPNARTREVTGRYGRATRIEPSAAMPAARTTLACWLLESMAFSPAWNQWALTVITLADVDGIGPAHKAFVGATHEMLLLALDPRKPWSQEQASQGLGFYHLSPANYVDQFEATDDEMVTLAAWMAWGMVNGHLQVEPNGSRDRESWLTSATKTLAHIRGEAHAR